MESDVTTCSICSHSYDEKERRPLVLPCSHSFCQSCLGQMETAKKRNCPNCRRYWGDKSVTDLLCCYQLMGLSPPAVGLGVNRCNDHRLELSCWCATCKISLCIRCVEKTHKRCDWSSIEQKEEDIKLEGDNLVLKLTKKMSEADLLSTVIEKFLIEQKKFAEWDLKVAAELFAYEGQSREKSGKDFGKKLEKLNKTICRMTELAEETPCLILPLHIAKAYQKVDDHCTMESFIGHLIENFDEGEQKKPSSPKLDNIDSDAKHDFAAQVITSMKKYAQSDGLLQDSALTPSSASTRNKKSRDQPLSNRVDRIPSPSLMPKYTQIDWKEKFVNFILQLSANVSHGPATLTMDCPELRDSPLKKPYDKIGGLLVPNYRKALPTTWNQLRRHSIGTLPLKVINATLIVRGKVEHLIVKHQYRHINLSKSFSRPIWSDHVEQCLGSIYGLFLYIPEINRESLPWIISELSAMTLNSSGNRIVASLILPGASSDPDVVTGWRRDFDSGCKDTSVQDV